MQKIDSIIDNKVYDYFQTFGTGTIEYLDNWKELLPKNLNQNLSNFDWSTTVTRNFQEVEKYISTSESELLSKVGFFDKFENTSHIQWRIIKDRDLNIDWSSLHHKLTNYFSFFKIWISQIPSGCCIPQHLDSIESFVEEYKVKESEVVNIKRLVILPEDIKPWHHLWYGNDIITKSFAGDVYKFNFWEPHGGSNLGPTPKYTIQVIGI